MNYDTIIIGAGHNGLTAAGLLARTEQRVLVLERREIVGGVAAAEEFCPGYRSAGLLADTSCVWPHVVQRLHLDRYGLRRAAQPPAVLAAQTSGPGLLISPDPDRTAAELRSFSPRDAEALAHLHALIQRVRPVVESVLNTPPPSPADLRPGNLLGLLGRLVKVRRLGARDLAELARIKPMCVADWLDEWFETDLLKGALALPAVRGVFAGPRSPGTAALLLLSLCTRHGAIAGGPAALVAALEASARDAGVAIRTGCAVERISIERGRVCGVVLAGGEQIAAERVVAACNPKHALLDLVEPGRLSHRCAERMRQVRSRGLTAVLRLALRGPLTLSGRDEPCEFACIAPGLEEIERAFDAVKYGTFSERPVLEIHVPSVSDDSLAPAGDSAVSILVHYAPHALDGWWDDRQRDVLQRAVLRVLAPYVDDLTDRIAGSELLTPVDLEARYGLAGGHLYHGEHALDQLAIRPTLDCARYATPIAGLYLASGGCYPGGGITCVPGALAAEVITHAAH